MSSHFALGPEDLRTVPQLPLTGAAIIAAACLLAAVALVIAAAALSRPSRNRHRNAAERGTHRDGTSASAWRKRIDDVVARHDSGEISREDAFIQLALITRSFASSATGTSLASSTLADLSRLHRSEANRQGLDMLKATIGALYPPEFADPAYDRTARNVSVAEAAEWVSNLVERWRP